MSYDEYGSNYICTKIRRLRMMRNERQGYGRHILLETLDLDFRSCFLERSPVKPRKFKGGESESRERSIDHVNS